MDHERWFGVELRHLMALAAVAREGSFRGAADSLGYVQSAVSQQVANLEGLVRARLVERCRGSKEVHLTEAGELLVTHAEDILARIHAARADLAAHVEGGDSVRLRLGICHQSVTAGLLAEILRRLASAAPELRVEPVEAADDDVLTDLLERGVVDLVLADLALDPSSYESRTVLSDPCALLVGADAQWTDGLPPETAAELAGLPLIALDGWRFLSSLEAWFASEGLVPSFVRRARGEGAVRALVGAGLGAAIVPALRAEELAGANGDPTSNGHRDGLTAIDLRGLVPMRRVAVHWHGARREQPGLDVLLEVTQEVGRRVSERRRPRPRFDHGPTPDDGRDGSGAPVTLAAA